MIPLLIGLVTMLLDRETGVKEEKPVGGRGRKGGRWSLRLREGTRSPGNQGEPVVTVMMSEEDTEDCNE